MRIEKNKVSLLPWVTIMLPLLGHVSGRWTQICYSTFAETLSILSTYL